MIVCDVCSCFTSCCWSLYFCRFGLVRLWGARPFSTQLTYSDISVASPSAHEATLTHCGAERLQCTWKDSQKSVSFLLSWMHKYINTMCKHCNMSFLSQAFMPPWSFEESILQKQIVTLLMDFVINLCITTSSGWLADFSFLDKDVGQLICWAVNSYKVCHFCYMMGDIRLDKLVK